MSMEIMCVERALCPAAMIFLFLPRQKFGKNFPASDILKAKIR